MPFVIQFPNRKYLRRANGYGASKRTLVDALENATTWSDSGHAKNAANAAISNRGIRLDPGEQLKIIEVALIELEGSAIAFTPKKVR